MALQMRQHVDMRMEQKLKLTPQMIQSIEILLLPQLALEERIMQEIEENPALEIADEADHESLDPSEAGGESSDGLRRQQVNEELERQSDLDHESYCNWLKARRENRAAADEDQPDRMEAINATAGPPPSLADHLLEQLRFLDLDEEDLQLATVICWQLDRRGYLQEGLTELFSEEQLERAERVWELVRGCEPPGVGAVDLRDCLLLQLQNEKGDNGFEEGLVQDHLDDVLHNRLPQVATEMKVGVDRVEEAVAAIARLNPSPGATFGRSENQIVVPDVIAEHNEDGEWVVSIPNTHLPKIEVNQSYYQFCDSEQATQRERAYLKEKLSSARFIIDAVAQRKRTLLKIATEIVKHQQDFLEYGLEHLRPLMRQDIADKIGMHVATVSRAVKDKYIQTPAGTLPLTTFFSGGIATQDGGEAESSRAVKLRIRKLIEEEDPKKPLSDQAIANLLAKDGLDISRRTVTKYRIAENIPSTRQRRSFS